MGSNFDDASSTACKEYHFFSPALSDLGASIISIRAGGHFMKWFWEFRQEGDFTPPQIATFLEGWVPAKADMKSEVPQESEVFTREIIQNFVDAARKERETNSDAGKPKLTFRFIELNGAAAKSLSERIDLKSLSDRYKNFDDSTKRSMRLQQSDTVLGNHTTIKLLVVSETNTCGMFGEWQRISQVHDAKGNEISYRMRDALMSPVRGSAGKGLGSFGEGKKAVIGISAPRTLFAYTCFDPNTTSDVVSRRFMGGVYWQNHIVGQENFSGFAMIGAELEQGAIRPKPFENEAADSVVRELALEGLGVRDSQLNRGTTYVFLDHSTSPEEVAESIARNWWPLMLDNGADFEVIRADGSEQPVVFGENLLPFISAYQCEGSQAVADWSGAEVGALATRVEALTTTAAPKLALGEMKLAIDLRTVVGWSRKDPDNNMSIVALIRDGMIISYQQFPKVRKLAAPFVRGTFTVSSEKHPEAADYLRMVEPPLHNRWQDEKRDLDPNGRRIAKDVYSSLNDHVRTFREEYVASTPTDEQDFEMFRENLSLTGGRRIVGRPDPLKKKTPWAMLSDTASVEDNNDGRRYAKASRSLQLSNLGMPSHPVTVQIGWEILEDNRWVAAEDFLETPIVAQQGWVLEDGSNNIFRGTVEHKPAIFSWKSKPYRELWTLRPYMKVLSTEVPAIESEDQ